MDRVKLLFAASALVVLMSASAKGPGKIVWRQSSFADFRAGELEDGGANTYISSRGAVQLANRWDFNNDGNIDLLFVGTHDYTENLDAWLYRGGKSFDPAKRVAVAANGGRWALIKDLNGDGLPEIVIANTDNGTIGDLDSFVYWGSRQGFQTDRRTELPTIFAGKPAAADLNHDGFVDLIFPNGGTVLLHPGDEVFHRGSFIYWGGRGGFRKDHMTELPTNNAVAAAVGDLDNDGWPDVVFANSATGKESSSFVYGAEAGGRPSPSPAESYIYWGGPQGYSAAGRTNLIMEGVKSVSVTGGTITFLDQRGVLTYRGAGGRRFDCSVVPGTAGAEHFAAGDLNGDGSPDLVLSGKTVRVLWSDGASGFKPGPILPVRDPAGVEIGDLNGDGAPDIVIANNSDGDSFTAVSYIYWNDGKNFSAAKRTALPTSGAFSSVIGDADGDGEPDLLFVNTRGGHVRRTPTYIYFGSAQGQYSASRRRVIETNGANDGASADINDDGFTDLVITQDTLDVQPIYWGGADAFATLKTTSLPMFGSYGAGVADLNRDGWLDLALSGYYRKPGAKTDVSRVYYGSKSGFSADRFTDLETPGAEPPLIADFNRDGWPDLVFPNRKTGSVEGSIVYYGGPNGFSKDRSQVMQTAHSTRAQAADLNADGWLDLVFSNQIENGNQFTPTLIYWGGPKGFTLDHRTSLPTWGGYGICVADYNRDGFLDMAIPSYKAYHTRKTDSKVFWGSAEGFQANNYTHLPSESGADCMAADFNSDGWTDLLILNHLKEGDHHVTANPSIHVTDSFIYYGGANGFHPLPARIPSVGAHCSNSLDYGNVYDRKLRWGYRSQPLEYKLRPASIHWEARTPFHSSVVFQVRTAETREGLKSAKWSETYTQSGSSLGKIDASHRWLQYRFELGIARGTANPEVSAVEFRAAP